MALRPLSNQAFGHALSGGTRLEPAVQADMEARFGTSFADVRVHDDADAHDAAEALQAKAYTVGNQLVFGAARFAPRSADGRKLLAHELAHVVQQRRGGASPELSPSGSHEAGASQAAAQVAAGAASVQVAGSTGVGVAREVEDDDRFADAEKEERRGKRSTEKRAAKLRAEERANVRGGAQHTLGSKARAEVNSMLEQVRRGDFALSSPDERLAALHRFKAALKDLQLPQLAKNKLQGRYDELLRTPRSNLSGDPQTKWVAGEKATPDMELPPRRGGYAQPDHSRMMTREQLLARYHVNLKSDTLEGLEPSEARSRGRQYAKQAARNARYLPEGEGIVLDFAEPGNPAVRDAICEGAFVKDGPVKEIRFHTRTILRSEWKGPVGPPIDVDARARKERLARERQKAKAAAKEAKMDAKERKAQAKVAEQQALEKIRHDARQGGETVRRKYIEEMEAQRKQAGKPEPTKKAQAKLESDARRAGKAAERKFLEENLPGKKAKRKPARKGRTGKGAGGKKAASKQLLKTAGKKALRKGTKPAKAAKPSKPAKPARTAASTQAPEVKGAAKAAPVEGAPIEAPKAAAPVEVASKAAAPVEVAPKGVTPKGVAQAGVAVVGGLMAVSGIKDIINDFSTGHPITGAAKTGLLGLSFIGEAAPPLLALGVGMTYWGPEHEAIQKNAFRRGEAVEDLIGKIPLVGRIPYLGRVAGAYTAAQSAVYESVGRTAVHMGEAVVEGAEILGGVAEDAYDWLTEGPSMWELMEQQRKRMQRGED